MQAAKNWCDGERVKKLGIWDASKQGLGSKRSSRKIQPNCAISFWFRQHLVLHACTTSLIWQGIFFLYSAKFWKIEELNKALVATMCQSFVSFFQCNLEPDDGPKTTKLWQQIRPARASPSGTNSIVRRVLDVHVITRSQNRVEIWGLYTQYHIIIKTNSPA